MHQPLDLEEQEQMQEWEEPSMCQPSETWRVLHEIHPVHGPKKIPSPWIPPFH
jgi:hypothetical protein